MKRMLLFISLVLGFSGCTDVPPNNVVKNIAIQYHVGAYKPDDVKIIKSYEKDGKTVMIMQIKKSICEMPMMKINDKWTATGISCSS